jgi:deazaflavin-dependent oxidoreductase (nitroreductase family)
VNREIVGAGIQRIKEIIYSDLWFCWMIHLFARWVFLETDKHTSIAGEMMSDRNDWNKAVIEEFRANQGKVKAMGGIPLLLLTTTGAKSGKSRLNPLAYVMDSNHWVVIASKGGAPTNPDWYYNVVANPVVDLEFGTGEHVTARATPISDGVERDRLYAKMVAVNPGFADYERKTTRKIPVVVLERAK